MNWRCILNWHEYDIIEKYDYTDTRGNVIGKMYVLQCKHCGTIKHKLAKTVSCYD